MKPEIILSEEDKETVRHSLARATGERWCIKVHNTARYTKPVLSTARALEPLTITLAFRRVDGGWVCSSHEISGGLQEPEQTQTAPRLKRVLFHKESMGINAVRELVKKKLGHGYFRVEYIAYSDQQACDVLIIGSADFPIHKRGELMDLLLDAR